MKGSDEKGLNVAGISYYLSKGVKLFISKFGRL
jgi:hypothetical protein